MQRFPLAGARDAFAALGHEEGTVVYASDQLSAGIEKGIGLPIERDAAMRAAIAVQEHPALSANTEQFEALCSETAALAFTQFSRTAKKMHD